MPRRRLPHPTADTLELTQAAANLVKAHFRGDCAYQRAGVVLQDLRPASGTVSAPTTADSLFDEADTADTACGRLTPSELRRTELMQTIDALCRRYSCDIVKTASSSLAAGWEMRRGNLSPCFTTRIDEVWKVNYVDQREEQMDAAGERPAAS